MVRCWRRFLMLYGVARYFLEFIRDDPGRGSVFGGIMTGTQLISICLVITGGFIWWLKSSPQSGSGARAAVGLVGYSQRRSSPSGTSTSVTPRHTARAYMRQFPLLISATADDAGKRLDQFLVAQLPETSRARVQQLISQELGAGG